MKYWPSLARLLLLLAKDTINFNYYYNAMCAIVLLSQNLSKITVVFL